MAIAAHFEDTADSTDTSRAPRRTLRLETQGELASGEATEVLLHNVSATGLLIETRTPLAVDERIAVDLPHAGPTWAKVIWVSGKLYGCQFDEPISSAALSATQLRSAVAEQVDLAPHHDLVPEESFGLRLQRLRKERALTLGGIATRLGVSKPTVWAWEQGKARPVESRIDALAEVLGVDRMELIAGRHTPVLRELLARSREQIAAAVGTSPENVKIMIEL